MRRQDIVDRAQLAVDLAVVVRVLGRHGAQVGLRGFGEGVAPGPRLAA